MAPAFTGDKPRGPALSAHARDTQLESVYFLAEQRVLVAHRDDAVSGHNARRGQEIRAAAVSESPSRTFGSRAFPKSHAWRSRCALSTHGLPGRGAQDALDALAVGITSRKVNFILDADIRAFFDEVSQDWLIRFVEHRVGDPRIIRLIKKWLKAGVLEDGVVTDSDRGTGQGSAISPLLGNIYLHYGIDLWAESWRQREAAGDMIIVRYADDIIVGFEREDDARRFLDAMRERLGKFALSLHPDKTRLIEFGRLRRTGALGVGLANRRRSSS